MTKPAEIQLASTDHEAVKSDVYKLIPDWNGGSDTRRLHPDGTLVAETDGEREPYQHIGGNAIHVIPIADRVIQPAIYDEETGEVISEAVMAGELRIDIEVPDWYEVTELATRVHPKNSDHNIA